MNYLMIGHPRKTQASTNSINSSHWIFNKQPLCGRHCAQRCTGLLCSSDGHRLLGGRPRWADEGRLGLTDPRFLRVPARENLIQSRSQPSSVTWSEFTGRSPPPFGERPQTQRVRGTTAIFEESRVCHECCLLLSIYVLSHFSHVQLYDPMDCSPPGSSVHEIL